jgi:hypothetical protein
MGSPPSTHLGLVSEKEFYTILEYGIISEEQDCFVMNQPYDFQTSKDILNQAGLTEWSNLIQRRFNYIQPDQEKKELIGLKLSPGISRSSIGSSESTIMFKVDGIISIGKMVLVNRFRLNDAKLKSDPQFHGDTKEWLYGYFDESYGIIALNDKVELFLGRMNRNFGTLNDYGLIMSDYSYAFDHFGFSATGDQLKYSFYVSRLNDILGEDTQGITMPTDTLMTTKRYWAIQRLDWRISKNFQIAFSEATVYGGPDQNWIASFLNPVHFFYSTQRNQKVEMNSSWQINIFWKPCNRIGMYFDLFADDLIINNESGVNDRDRYPDRLGFLWKISFTDVFQEKSLTSIRYVRIWNETYTSYRTFENYRYFNKSIGYPLNSYEGLKLSHSSFDQFPWVLSGDIEIWRHGNSNIIEVFYDEVVSFPVGPVTYGINAELNHVSYDWHGFEIQLNTKIVWSADSWDNLFDNSDVSRSFDFQILYPFSF